MTKEQFFNELNINHWNLTVMDEENDTLPILQVGLVATFYLVDAYQPARRRSIALALELYCKYFGTHLAWGYIGGEKIIQYDFNPKSIQDCIDYIQRDGISNSAAFRWSSQKGFEHTGAYMFGAYSPAGWFEQIHSSLTTVRFYLPTDELNNLNNLDNLLTEFCNLLRPLHGAAGLGIQHSFEWENYQHTEFELTQEYRGVDLCIPSGNKSWRTGYSNLNWYTYLTQHWLEKLGTKEAILEKLDDVRITVLPYDYGTIIKAGNWPSLGKSDHDPQPTLYVKVNEILKPLRVKNVGSLHYGSVSGEVRFNERTSNLWLRRFDLPPGSLSAPPPSQYRRLSISEQRRIDDERLMFYAFLNSSPNMPPEK